MYLQYRNLKLIEISGRPDEDNEKILNGKYDNSENPLTKEERLKMIFSDWQVGDSLVIADSPLKYPKVQGDTLVEMSLYEAYKSGLYKLNYNEAIYREDIIVLKAGQYIDEKGVLQTVPKIEGTRVEWNWKTNEWEEKATNLEIVQAQYRDYEGMDTPSTLEEMKQQDPAMAEEFLNMMIELRSLIYTLSTDVQTLAEDRAVGFATLPIPQPSKALKDFKNKFNLTR